MNRLNNLYNQAGNIQQPPPLWTVLLTAALALALITPRRIWPVTRNVVTVAHEAGHALIALLAGRRLSAIRLHSDTSGVTVSAGKPTGPGMIATTAAGYTAPALLGLAVAVTLSTGHAAAALIATLALLTGMLLLIRNLHGAAIVLTIGALTYTVLTYTPDQAQSAFAHLLCWFLTLAALRPVWELHQHRRNNTAPDNDADQLARLTGLPGGLWVLLFALVNTLAALYTSSVLILG